jgi:hypothetical protein
MKNKKKIWFVGLLALAINLVSVYFFMNRNKLGNYIRQVSYEELYSPSQNTPARIKSWKKIIDQYTASQAEEGKKLTKAYAGISDKDPALNKMIKIGVWLRRSFGKCSIGQPTAVFNNLSLTEQYRAAANAESPVWCGTFGTHFLFFCSINGITCRYIESYGKADNHIINECYIPELGQWVFVDLLNNVLYSKDKTGKILNTIDLLYLNARKDTAAFTVFEQEDNNSGLTAQRNEYANTWKNYLDSANLLRFYYITDPVRVYTFREKAIRYIYPKTWYETFSLTVISNKAFYLRIFFLYSGIIAAIFFILFYLKSK